MNKFKLNKVKDVIRSFRLDYEYGNSGIADEDIKLLYQLIDYVESLESQLELEIKKVNYLHEKYIESRKRNDFYRKALEKLSSIKSIEKSLEEEVANVARQALDYDNNKPYWRIYADLLNKN